MRTIALEMGGSSVLLAAGPGVRGGEIALCQAPGHDPLPTEALCTDTGRDSAGGARNNLGFD